MSILRNRLPWVIFLLAGSSAASANIYFVATDGNDSATGNRASPWKTLSHAQSLASPGDTVFIRGGTYTITAGENTCASPTDTVNAILLDRSGTASSPIRYFAFPGETPVFDFSQMTDNCRVKGFHISASWIHLKGLEIEGVPQGNNLNHESWGVWINGSHNVLEHLNIHNIQGPGVYLYNGGYNLVLNTDSHDNYDPRSSNGAGQNADGFGAHIKADNPGNVFRGCRAWNNTDDGFDLIRAYSPVVIENSWAWSHGYLPGTSTPVAAGNGNGFKLGGYGGVYVDGGQVHTIRNSVAFRNKVNGFYANHHTVANIYYNNTGFNNGTNFNLLSIAADGNAIYLGILRNNLAYGGTPTGIITGVDSAYNSWDLGLTITDTDFESVSVTGWDAPRLPDGSLPRLSSLHPAHSAVFIDKGIDVGLPYNGLAPDLGAFEAWNAWPHHPRDRH